MIAQFLARRGEVDPAGRYVPALEECRKALNESVFEIALAGEFQGGKSTTFNLLLGGREISPRGLNGGGIKTSAAVVAAQNIDGDETKNGLAEWAEISWLGVDEIKRRVKYVLADYAEGGAAVGDGDDVEALLERAWSLSPKDDRLDLLRVATLQWRVLQDPRFAGARRRTVAGIGEFQSLVRFPREWETRWLAGKDARFEFGEMLPASTACWCG